MVMSGRSVHLTTLFLGRLNPKTVYNFGLSECNRVKSLKAFNQYFMHILSPVTEQHANSRTAVRVSHRETVLHAQILS